MDYLGSFSTSAAVALPAAAIVYLWERWRLARPGGPYARADFSGLILLIALAAAWWPHLTENPQLTAVLFGGGLIFLIAALADNWSGGWWLALLGVGVVAALLSYQGITVGVVNLPFSQNDISLGWLGPVVTVVWLVICSVLFAQAATILAVPLGVAGLAAGTLFVVCLLQPTITGSVAALMAVTICGASLPQVPFARLLSYGQARAGAYTAGYLVGAISVVGALKNTAFLVALVPLIIVGVPLFAATYSYAAELRRGWRAVVFAERRGHLHDLLLRQGYSQWQVTGLLLGGTVYLCLLVLLLVWMIEVTFVIKTVVVLAALAFGLLFLYTLLRFLPQSRAGHPPATTSQVRLLGMPLDPITVADALEQAERFLEEDHPHMIVTPDASAVVRAQRDPELREIIEQADLVAPDGAGVVLAARLLNLPVNVRCAGCDMVEQLCQAAANKHRSVYLLGGEPAVAQQAAANLQQRIPGLQVAGCHDGYFTDEEEPQIVEDIRNKRPGVLLVALGIPRQEKWIKKHLEELGVPICIGVGGSLDVISGRKRRAPVWMQRAGLEWLYRTIKEPSRLPRLVALPKIVWMSIRELLRPSEVPPQSPPGGQI